MGSEIKMIDCEKCGELGYVDNDYKEHLITTGCDSCGYKKTEKYNSEKEENDTLEFKKKFFQALENLGIQDYSEEIYESFSDKNSASLLEYVILSNELKTPKYWFKLWFERTIEFVKKRGGKAELVYRNILESYVSFL
jgi:DNA-directed RNA polymerase subunit M/transcription elongation factor TFIIS